MPGGYVDFRFSPGIKSLNRLYHATIITYALPPDGFIDDALWPYNRADVGKKWGSSLSGSNHTFVVKHRVTILNDEALAGKTVRFLVRYSINYPERFGTFFRNRYENFDEYILVELK